MRKWKMPKWMEPFREYIGNTGGNDVEDLVNAQTNPEVNLPLWTLQACVQSQCALLERLRKNSCLREKATS